MSFVKLWISRIDPFPVLIVAASVVGVAALFQPGFIETHDGLFHLHRMVAFDQALHEGDFYPRWFPEFALGYGYPVLNFYAPLSYYVAEFFHLLGLGLLASEKLTFAVSFTFSGLAMYLWISQSFVSRRAGFIAAVAYLYFPYRMVDIYVRGALAECLAFVFFPLMLWSTYKLIVGKQKDHVWIGSVLLALLVLTHNISALFFVPIWFGYASLLIFFGPGSNLRDIRVMASQALMVTLSLVVGIALSTFYWLPALQEQVYASTGNFKIAGSDPITQISAFDNLIQTQWVYDYIKRPIEAGFVQLIVFTIGVFGLLFLPVMRKHLTFSIRPYVTHGLFFVLLAVAGILMMSPTSIPVWEAVPLIENIQFPWRLLGFVGLGTAVLTALLSLNTRSFMFIGLPVVAVLAFSSMYGMPLIHKYVNEEDLTIPQAIRYEFDSGVFGGTASAEYIPVWARSSFAVPRDEPAFRTAEKDTSNSFLNIAVEEVRRNRYTVSVTSEQGGPLRLHQFFFPGWQARLDGKDTQAYPSTLIGLVTVDVPPGSHRVEMFFGDSDLRSVGRKVSTLAVVLLAIIYLSTFRRQQSAIRYSVPMLSVATLMFYVNAGLPQTSPEVAGADLPPHAFRSQPFELDSLRLAGFELDARSASTDGRVRAVLYWQSLGKKSDTSVLLSIKSPDGTVVGSRLTRPIYGTARTYLWSLDELVQDEVYVPIETSIAPGRYSLELSTVAGSELLATADLGTFSLPGVSVAKDIPPVQAIDLTFGGKMRLLGFTAHVNDKELKDEKTPLTPGDTIKMRMYWKSLGDMSNDYTAFLHLLDSRGIRLAQIDSQPRAGYRQTTQWLKGDLVVDDYVFYLPELMPMGVFRMEMGLYYLRTMERLPIDERPQNSFILRRFKVLPKEQSNEDPASPTNAVLGDSMRLIGASIGQQSDVRGSQVQLTAAPGAEINLPVRLFWRPEKAIQEDYAVFIHVLDATGSVVAQQDNEPMKGAYPTSFWAPGEKVLDDYAIILRGLPPGDYRLEVGAYSKDTMTRLRTELGGDSVSIGSVQIRDSKLPTGG